MFRNVPAAAALAWVLASGAAAAGTEIPEGADSLDAVLQPYLDRYGLPALAAAVVKDGEIIAAGAVGTRRHGADVPVTVHDRFHLGSDTKAMTSLLAAMLVEEGKLGWDTTVGGMFPERAETMDAELKGVTLDQLLSHASGIPSDTEEDFRLMLEAQARDDLNLDEARLWLVGQIAARPLQSRPGEQFAYSNIGYVLAGAMIERVNERRRLLCGPGAHLTPKTIQTFAGHSSLQVTMDRYGHLFPSDDHKAAMDLIAKGLAQ